MRENLREPGEKPTPSGLMDIQNVGLQEIVRHPFGSGNLTTTGQQYSNPATSGTTESTYATVGLATVDAPGFNGEIAELEMGLTCAVRSESTAPSTVTWLWQGRDVGHDTWKNLASTDATATEGTAYIDYTISGFVTLDANLNSLPFELQLKVMSGNISDGVAKIKNSTYVRALTSALYKRNLD